MTVSKNTFLQPNFSGIRRRESPPPFGSPDGKSLVTEPPAPGSRPDPIPSDPIPQPPHRISWLPFVSIGAGTLLALLAVFHPWSQGSQGSSSQGGQSQADTGICRIESGQPHSLSSLVNCDSSAARASEEQLKLVSDYLLNPEAGLYTKAQIHEIQEVMAGNRVPDPDSAFMSYQVRLARIAGLALDGSSFYFAQKEDGTKFLLVGAGFNKDWTSGYQYVDANGHIKQIDRTTELPSWPNFDLQRHTVLLSADGKLSVVSV